MELRDKIFFPVFIITLLVSLFLLGGTLTGNLVYDSQSMHCKAEGCYQICDSTQDCNVNQEVCCEKNNFGICKIAGECDKEYVFSPEGEFQENIRSTSSANTITFSATTILVLIVGTLYYFSRRTHKNFSKKEEF
jgi:hypothetical protein